MTDPSICTTYEMMQTYSAKYPLCLIDTTCGLKDI